MVARRRARASRGNADYWGGAPASDTLRVRIIPEALTQAAEYESGRLSVVEVPSARPRAGRARTPPSSSGGPRSRDSTSRSTPRAGRSRTCGCGGRSTRRSTSTRSCRNVAGGRGVLAGGRDSARARGLRLDPAPYAYDPPRRASAARRGGLRRRSRSSSGAAARPSYARIAQAMQQDLAQVGVTVEIVERDAAERARGGAQRRGRPLPHRLVRRLPRRRRTSPIRSSTRATRAPAATTPSCRTRRSTR